MNRHASSAGTVSLVALCFVAVLGIVLASYLAICTRAMTLSNRSFQATLGRQLAELGLEEGLRAYNKYDWSNWSTVPSGWTASAWTLDTTNKRASRTLTLDATRLGQGMTATVKIRIDNYDSNQLSWNWNSSSSYHLNDMVARSGVWYRSVLGTLASPNTNNTPSTSPGNLIWWVPAPVPWAWCSNTNYTQDYDVVCQNGAWYRCSSTHTSGSTWSASNWTLIPAPVFAITSSTSYTAGTFGFRVGDSTWYRCTTTHVSGGTWASESAYWTTAAPYIAWAYRSSTTYNFNDLVYYSSTAGVAGTWYRCTAATSTGNAPTNTSYWENTTQSGAMTSWSSSGVRYASGDVVYYPTTSQWYRCLQSHTSSGSLTPTNTSYWANAPRYDPAWMAGRRYSQNDTVFYNGVWYLSLQNANSNQNPATATTYWVGADTSSSSYTWNASTAYSAGAYRCYGGVWYKCVASNMAQSPNNSNYWTAAWNNQYGITTGASVLYAESVITIGGNPPIRTQIRAPLSPAPLFPNAVGAKTSLSASAAGTVDSFDGSVYTMTSGGIYSPYTYNQTTTPFTVTANVGFSAVVAAGSSVTLSSPAIKGYLAWPSPPGGVGTSTSVKGATSPTSPNIDTSRVSRSPYIPQFDPLPTGGLTSNWATTPKGVQLPGTGVINLGSPGDTLPSRYYCSSLTIDGSPIASININGPVILYVQGDLTLSGTAANAIYINSTGSAEIHVGDGLKVNQTSGGIVNRTLDPKRLSIICDTASSDVQNYSDGSNAFYGTIYLPNTTNSNGLLVDNSAVDIYGAISAKKITFSGADMNVHYDTSLRYARTGGVDQPSTISEWRLLSATELATMP